MKQCCQLSVPSFWNISAARDSTRSPTPYLEYALDSRSHSVAKSRKSHHPKAAACTATPSQHLLLRFGKHVHCGSRAGLVHTPRRGTHTHRICRTGAIDGGNAHQGWERVVPGGARVGAREDPVLTTHSAINAAPRIIVRRAIFR
eukprot:460816-Rhodomonas_salina.1